MHIEVRYLDHAQRYRKMRSEILQTVDAVLNQGDAIRDQQLLEFEADLAAFCGRRYTVGTGSCADALRFALHAAAIGPGDEVITTSHASVATAAAIHHTGATPVLVDIADDHNIDPSSIEAAVTSRTRAILPVHLNGRVARMDRIQDIALRHGLLVIEDASQALGATFQERKAGSFGLAGCFSVDPGLLLGGLGDGGALVTDDLEVATRVRALRDDNSFSVAKPVGWPFHSRLDNLQAAILGLKLKRLPGWIARRREIASLYHEKLSGIGQIVLPPVPLADDQDYDVFQHYEIEVEHLDDLRAFLLDSGVETRLPWGGRGIHQFPALGLTHFRLPRTEFLFTRALLLPMHCELANTQVIYVADCVRRFYEALEYQAVPSLSTTAV